MEAIGCRKIIADTYWNVELAIVIVVKRRNYRFHTTNGNRYHLANRPYCSGWRNLDGGKHGGDCRERDYAYHRYAN